MLLEELFFVLTPDQREASGSPLSGDQAAACTLHCAWQTSCCYGGDQPKGDAAEARRGAGSLRAVSGLWSSNPEARPSSGFLLCDTMYVLIPDVFC